MRLFFYIAVVCVVLGSSLTGTNVAYATNGYFTHGVGAKSKGMAGAGMGSDANMGAITVASNPALAVFAGDGWEGGLSLFSPRRSYSASASQANGQGGAFTIGQGGFDSGSEWFPIPNVAKNWKLANDRNITFMFYGRGGMNTDWDDGGASALFDPDGPGPAQPAAFPGPFGGGNAGVDLSQAFLAVTYSGKVSEQFAWGVGPVIAVQAFEATGVGSFAPFTRTFAASGGMTMPTALTNNGHEFSFGVGLSAGIWWGLSDRVSVGFAYQTKTSMSEFDDYADLFAEQGGFDIPASARLGLSINASDAVRLNIDVEHALYGDVDSVGNPMSNIAGCPTAGLGGTDLESCLGGANGAGFGWDDMTTYKLGAEWRVNNDYTWRAGFSFGDQPISSPNVVFNILAPGVMEQHLTLGMTKTRAQGGEWTFAFMYAPEETVTGPNLFDPTQTIDISMKQFEFELGFAW